MIAGFETSIIGMLCGAVFGAIAVLSRRLLAGIFCLTAAWMTLVAVDGGLVGLENAVSSLFGEALVNQQLVLGAVVGFLLVVVVWGRDVRADTHHGGWK